ncbi:hypothetical protein INT80_14670 [Gallibacterium anatis]|uniref:Uncharacterized protein n=1 Tax=Gallibacterium anatis TaxID=750 RepID=A0A930YAZ1_9PAST|nr:hypothetical protein [Gallibacterium anatis]
MWRNLANYMPLQGIDELYDQNSIIDTFPESKLLSPIGVLLMNMLLNWQKNYCKKVTSHFLLIF